MEKETSKDSLKVILKSLAELGESLSTLKSKLNKNEVDGGSEMSKTEDVKKEAAKAAAEDAEAKKVAAEDAEAKMKDEAEAAKKKADEEAEAKKKEEAEAAKKKEEEAKADKEDKSGNTEEKSKAKKEANDNDADDAKAGADSEFNKKKAEVGSKAMDEAECAKAGLSEAEKTLATKYNAAELVKLLASMSLELASLKEEVAKEKAEKVAEARFVEISEMGFGLSGEKAIAQKKRYADMSESSFASYKEELASFKSLKAEDKDQDLKEVAKAGKAQAGKLSVDVEISKQKEDLVKQFSKLG